MYNKAYGALYVHYLETNQDEKQKSIEDLFPDKRRESLIYGAANFYWETGEFDKAEAMLDKSDSYNAPDSFERLFYAKQGYKNAMNFHNLRLLAFREYRERFNYQAQF